MKKQLLTAIAVTLSLCGYAQTKGTNAVSLGISSTTSKASYPSANIETTTKSNIFSFGYGLFVKDNTKIGLDLNYGADKSENSPQSISKIKYYGGKLSYQKYYPIVKTLFAYAGGNAGYSYSNQSNNSGTQAVEYKTNHYTVGAYGGVTWFVSKRFAFETSLLSADVAYAETNQVENTQSFGYKNKQTSFNLNTQGFINNLGFKIYILF